MSTIFASAARPLRPMDLSYSKIQDLRCPFRFQQKYVLGVEEDDSEYSRFGIFMHSVQALYRQILAKQGLKRSQSVYERLLDKHLAAEWPDASDDEIADARGIGHKFYAGYKMRQGADRFIIERRFHLTEEMLEPISFVSDSAMDVYPGALFSFTTDCAEVFRTQGVIYARDEKYGFRQLEQDGARMEVEDDLQARLYSFGLMKLEPEVNEVHFTIACPRFGPRHQQTAVFTRERLFDLSDEDAPENIIRQAWVTLRSMAGMKAWPALPGRACRFCGPEIDCPAAADMWRRIRSAA